MEKEHNYLIKVIYHALRCKRLIGLTFSASIDILRVRVNPNGFLIHNQWERVLFELRILQVCIVPTYPRPPLAEQ